MSKNIADRNYKKKLFLKISEKNGWTKNLITFSI